MSKTRVLKKDTKPVDEVMNDIAETEKKEKPIHLGIVTASALNVRKEPSLKSEILQMVYQNDKIEILEDKEELWYKIKVDGKIIGFCMKTYIKAQ